MLRPQRREGGEMDDDQESSQEIFRNVQVQGFLLSRPSLDLFRKPDAGNRAGLEM